MPKSGNFRLPFTRGNTQMAVRRPSSGRGGPACYPLSVRGPGDAGRHGERSDGTAPPSRHGLPPRPDDAEGQDHPLRERAGEDPLHLGRLGEVPEVPGPGRGAQQVPPQPGVHPDEAGARAPPRGPAHAAGAGGDAAGPRQGPLRDARHDAYNRRNRPNLINNTRELRQQNAPMRKKGGSTPVAPRQKTQRVKKKAEPQGDCFIATAVNKDPLSPELGILRTWRVRRLEPSMIGHVIISTYYWLGPTMASIISNRPRLRKIVKHILDGFIGLIRES